MLYETINQPYICLILLVIGFLSGFVYDISNYIIFLCKNNKIIKIIFDFISTLIVFGIFYLSILQIDYGQMRFYHFLVFFVFLILQRITLGKIIAKAIDICYNVFIKIFSYIGGIKFGRRKKQTID